MVSHPPADNSERGQEVQAKHVMWDGHWSKEFIILGLEQIMETEGLSVQDAVNKARANLLHSGSREALPTFDEAAAALLKK